MQSKDRLSSTLERIDGRGYKAYKELQKNWYDFGDFAVGIPYVQGDPYASPSSIFVRVESQVAGFPAWYAENGVRVLALEDYLAREIASRIDTVVKGHRGSGKSGMITIARPGQEVLKRTAVEYSTRGIEARICMGLPARGRKVMGYQAREMFFEELPAVVEGALYHRRLDADALRRHVEVVEEQHVLRQQLTEHGLVSFIANRSILPRESGVSDRPLGGRKVVPFTSPPGTEVEFELPYSGRVRGMGLREGITLIVGGGYHGKSTLLEAVEKGIYDHIPGDGREHVVTRVDAVKIRAEDGRRIEKVDISPFIDDLPHRQTTTAFRTANASGSTSQAANIMEALELGTGLLLIDEDTCATNLMIRDARMQRLVAGGKEPITPFIDRVQALHAEHGVSTILVVGGAGDYFDVADHVLMMDEYRPREVTEQARAIASQLPSQREEERRGNFGAVRSRIPAPQSINPRRGRKTRVKARGLDSIQFGNEEIDLNHLEQLTDRGQARAIGDLLVYGLKEDIIDGRRTMREILQGLYRHLEREGLKVISPFQPDGNYALPRPLEVGAALNRLRSLEVAEQRD